MARALEKLQEDCNVAEIRMSDYGISPDEFEDLARNGRDTMGVLFDSDRSPLSIEDCINI